MVSFRSFNPVHPFGSSAAAPGPWVTGLICARRANAACAKCLALICRKRMSEGRAMQVFEARMSSARDRLAAVRAAMRAQNLEGFLVPRADEHLGEYVPPSAERLAWLTGFTGSAGLAVVLRDRAAAFTDGRYTLQLAAQTDPGLVRAASLGGRAGPGLDRRAHRARRPHRLRPDAGERGRTGEVPRRRAEPRAGRPQPGGRGMARPAAAAAGRGGAAPAALRGKSLGREAGRDCRRAARRQTRRGGGHRPGLDRLAAEHQGRRCRVYAVRARLSADGSGRDRRLCSWTRPSCRPQPGRGSATA